MFEQSIERAFEPSGDGRIAEEFRVRGANDGKKRWVSSTGGVHFGAQGKPLRVVGVIADVTERKQARSAEDRFARLAATSSNCCICIDAGGAITFWNATAERILGYAASEVIGRSIEMIIPGALCDPHWIGMWRARHCSISSPFLALKLDAIQRRGSLNCSRLLGRLAEFGG